MTTNLNMLERMSAKQLEEQIERLQSGPITPLIQNCINAATTVLKKKNRSTAARKRINNEKKGKNVRKRRNA